jgi:hypothetical protein
VKSALTAPQVGSAACVTGGPLVTADCRGIWHRRKRYGALLVAQQYDAPMAALSPLAQNDQSDGIVSTGDCELPHR